MDVSHHLRSTLTPCPHQTRHPAERIPRDLQHRRFDVPPAGRGRDGLTGAGSGRAGGPSLRGGWAPQALRLSRCPLRAQSSTALSPQYNFSRGSQERNTLKDCVLTGPLLVGLLGARRVGRRTHARLGQQVPPVLALTGSPSVGDQEAGFEAGMAEVLTRPLTLEALGAALDGERVLTSEPQRACARSSVRVVHSRAGDCARCEGLQEPMSGSRCKSGAVPPP
jgi:hypothetical protein